MKFVVDVCLSKEVAEAIGQVADSSTDWSEIGPNDAKDSVIMEWCVKHDHVLVTADLDFGSLLKYSGKNKPSVVILRTADHLPSTVIPLVLEAIARFKEELYSGCLIAVNERTARLRRLPIGS